MRKRAVLVTLVVLELVALALSLFFWLVMRRDLLGTYGHGPVPPATKLALSGWFVPLTACVGAFFVLAALSPRWRTRTRNYLVGTGLVCTVFGLFFAIWASYAPAFDELGR